MTEKQSRAVFIRQFDGNYKYFIPKPAADKPSWNKLSDTAINYLKDNFREADNIIVLPNNTVLSETPLKSTLVLVSKQIKDLINYYNLLPGTQILEVNAVINKNGFIEKELSEPEINKALRNIFKLKPRKIIIAFSNSVLNPVHENNIRNVLKVAGYIATPTHIT